MRSLLQTFYRTAALSLAALSGLGLMVGARNANAQTTGTAPISLQGQGPYYRLKLPAAIYGYAAPGLHDLRIRNAAGHAVPYAWLQDEAAPPHTASKRVPIFALPMTDSGKASGEADPALVFKVRSDGSLALTKPVSAAFSRTKSWLIDTSQVAGNLLQARFEVAPDAQGVFPFTLEASDDLNQWRPVGGNRQLVLLSHQGQRIERLSTDLGSLRARFLRLRWIDPSQGLALTSVEIDSVQEVEVPAPQEWSGMIKPEHCATDYCDYRLPRGFPSEALRIALAEPNTLAQVQIFGLLDSKPLADTRPVLHRHHNPLYELRHRHHRQSAPLNSNPSEAAPLASAVIYRLALAGGETHSADIPLDGTAYPRLRIRTQGAINALGSTPPDMQVAIMPRTLVFLAQGQGPFSLAWGARPSANSAEGAPITLAALVPGHVPTSPVTADMAVMTLPYAPALAGASAASVSSRDPSDPEASGSQRKLWLWGALLAGLLLLAGMAWSLFSSMKQDKAEMDPSDPIA